MIFYGTNAETNPLVVSSSFLLVLWLLFYWCAVRCQQDTTHWGRKQHAFAFINRCREYVYDDCTMGGCGSSVQKAQDRPARCSSNVLLFSSGLVPFFALSRWKIRESRGLYRGPADPLQKEYNVLALRLIRRFEIVIPRFIWGKMWRIESEFKQAKPSRHSCVEILYRAAATATRASVNT